MPSASWGRALTERNRLPLSEAAAAVHLYEQERALIEKFMPEGQLSLCTEHWNIVR